MAEKKWSVSLTRFVGRHIAQRRKVLGISARELGERTRQYGEEVPQQVITNLENGRRDSLSVAELIVISSALEIAPAELLFPAKEAGLLTEYLPGKHTFAFAAREWFSGLDDVSENSDYQLVRSLLAQEHELRGLVLDVVAVRRGSTKKISPRVILALVPACRAMREAIAKAGVALFPPGEMLQELYALPDDKDVALNVLDGLLEDWADEE